MGRFLGEFVSGLGDELVEPVHVLGSDDYQLGDAGVLVGRVANPDQSVEAIHELIDAFVSALRAWFFQPGDLICERTDKVRRFHLLLPEISGDVFTGAIWSRHGHGEARHVRHVAGNRKMGKVRVGSVTGTTVLQECASVSDPVGAELVQLDAVVAQLRDVAKFRRGVTVHRFIGNQLGDRRDDGFVLRLIHVRPPRHPRPMQERPTRSAIQPPLLDASPLPRSMRSH